MNYPQQQTFIFDVCKNRHKMSETSVEANLRAENTKTHWQAEVLKFAELYGKDGFTLKDVCRALDKPLNALSGRLSEVKALGLIEPIEGERREGCQVYQLTNERACK